MQGYSLVEQFSNTINWLGIFYAPAGLSENPYSGNFLLVYAIYPVGLHFNFSITIPFGVTLILHPYPFGTRFVPTTYPIRSLFGVLSSIRFDSSLFVSHFSPIWTSFSISYIILDWITLFPLVQNLFRWIFNMSLFLLSFFSLRHSKLGAFCSLLYNSSKLVRDGEVIYLWWVILSNASISLVLTYSCINFPC